MKIYIKAARNGFLIECIEPSSSKHFFKFADTKRELDHLLHDHLGVQVRFFSRDINRLSNGEIILIQDGHLVYGKEP